MAWGVAQECGRGLADGFGARGGLGAVAAHIGEAGVGEGGGLAVDEGGSGGVDAFEGVEGVGEGLGFEDGGELGEGEAVDLAEVEGGDARVDEVLEDA